MGYLSQKKRKIRESLFLNVMLVLLICMTLLSFFDPFNVSKFFNFFHIYCLSGLFFFYSLFVKRFRLSVLFILVFTLNYTVLAISGNIFLSNSYQGKNNYELSFAPQSLLSDNFPRNKIIASGTLIVAQKYISPYVALNETAPLVFIRVDFRGASKKEYPLIFNHLYEFIIKQDIPVVIFGEFGIPAWDSSFRAFLDKTNLTIKNRLLFTESSQFNIFTLPSFYVLGFREMGVNAIHIQDVNGEKIIKINISFNSEMH